MKVAPLPLEEFIADLAAIPLGMVLPVISWMQATLHGKEMNRQVQLEVAAGLFRGTAGFPPLLRFLEMNQARFDGDLEARIPPGGREPIKPWQERGSTPEKLLDRGARMVFESGRPIAHVARDLGIHHETLASGCARQRPTPAYARIC